MNEPSLTSLVLTLLGSCLILGFWVPLIGYNVIKGTLGFEYDLSFVEDGDGENET